MISFKFLFENTNFVVPHSKIFFWIAASVSEAAAINPKGTKMHLAKRISTFPSKGKPLLGNGLPKNASNYLQYIILGKWVFKNFILFDKPLAKALRSF